MVNRRLENILLIGVKIIPFWVLEGIFHGKELKQNVNK